MHLNLSPLVKTLWRSPCLGPQRYPIVTPLTSIQPPPPLHTHTQTHHKHIHLQCSAPLPTVLRPFAHSAPPLCPQCSAPRPVTDSSPAATAARQTASLSWPAAMTPLKSLPPLLLLAGLAAGRKIFPGECPQTTIMSNLSLQEYTAGGPWYEQKRYLPPNGTLTSECQSYSFSDSGNGSIDFVQRAKSIYFGYYEMRGKLERLNQSGQDQTQASFYWSLAGDPRFQVRLNYNVLHADNNCSIIWDCITRNTSVNGTVSVKSDQLLWIMTRTRSPSENVTASCYRSLKSVLPGYDENSLWKINQEGC